MKEYQTPDDIKKDLISTFSKRIGGDGYESNLIVVPHIPPSIELIIKPILVCYLDVSRIPIEEVDEYCQKIAVYFEEQFLIHGWLTMVIPIFDGRDSFIESHVINKLQEQEFENFKEQILQKIKGE